MKGLSGATAIIVGSVVFVASLAPAQEVAQGSPPRIKLESDALSSFMTITGTSSADRLLIDQESAPDQDRRRLRKDRAPRRQLCAVSAPATGGNNNCEGWRRARMAADSIASPFLVGESGDDRLLGGSNADNLDGGTGDDLLRGRGDADHLYGSRGDDALNGGVGPDALFGGTGHDQCVGGPGDDHRRRDC